MDFNQFTIEVFKNFVIPGALGGFMISFAIYLISLGVSYGYKTISSFVEVEEIGDI